MWKILKTMWRKEPQWNDFLDYGDFVLSDKTLKDLGTGDES